jgi:hypothetical protein
LARPSETWHNDNFIGRKDQKEIDTRSDDAEVPGLR